MEGMVLKLIPVIARCLLGRLSMFGPLAGTSGTMPVLNSAKKSLVVEVLVLEHYTQ